MTTKPAGKRPVNEKEYLNTHLTRRQVREEIRRYHQANVQPVQEQVTWMMAPWWRKLRVIVRAWWKREVRWPPREPRWWPEGLGWTEEGA